MKAHPVFSSLCSNLSNNFFRDFDPKHENRTEQKRTALYTFVCNMRCMRAHTFHSFLDQHLMTNTSAFLLISTFEIKKVFNWNSEIEIIGFCYIFIMFLFIGELLRADSFYVRLFLTDNFFTLILNQVSFRKLNETWKKLGSF